MPLQSQSFQVNVPLIQTKWTLLPSDEIQNDIQPDAEKHETEESIIHFRITHVEGTDYMRALISYSLLYHGSRRVSRLSKHKLACSIEIHPAHMQDSSSIYAYTEITFCTPVRIV